MDGLVLPAVADKDALVALGRPLDEDFAQGVKVALVGVMGKFGNEGRKAVKAALNDLVWGRVDDTRAWSR